MVKRFRMRAFTLIELLVVIAIIAILAAILFPVFAQARAKARQATCTSNQKQVSLGLLQYLQDYDERFPKFEYDDPGAANYAKADTPWGPWKHYHMDWNKETFPYVKSIGVYRCPDVDDGNDSTDPGKNDDGWTGACNYAMNGNLDGVNATPLKIAALNFPASTILLSETGRNSSTGTSAGVDGQEWGWTGDHKVRLVYADSTATPSQNDTQQKNRPSLQRHGGGAVYAFADGHAKWFNAHNMGLKSDNTADDTSVDAAVGTHDGSKPTYFPN